LHRLGAAFDSRIVLTGVSFDAEHLGAASFDPKTGHVHFVMAELVPGYYHGTGDVFGSGLLSALMTGFTLEDAIQVAVDFTVQSIKRTDTDREPRYGVRFEAALPGLMRALGL